MRGPASSEVEDDLLNLKALGQAGIEFKRQLASNVPLGQRMVKTEVFDLGLKRFDLLPQGTKNASVFPHGWPE